MRKSDCDICCGEGTVRMRIHHRTSAFEPDAVPQMIQDSHRSYACPECGGAVPAERAHVLEQHTIVEGRIKDKRYHESRRELIARAMADKLLKEGFITFSQTARGDCPPLFRDPGSFILRGRLGVVSQNFVKKLDERVAEHQTEIAEQTIDAAVENIRIWGSALDWQTINKEEACRQVRQALPDVLGQRARWRPAI